MKKIGRKISYLLRHNPDGLNIDKNGWVKSSELIKKLNIDFDTLKYIVDNNDKKRYIFNDDLTYIRALQGHTLNIEPILEEKIPPNILYHGTTPDNIDSIYDNGIIKMKRQHVHLSEKIETAYQVGKRYSKNKEPIILSIKSKKMYDDGYIFFLSINNVWLTDFVPFEYIIKN